MKDFLDIVLDPQFMLALLTAVGAAATVITIALPMIEKDPLKARIKSSGVGLNRL